MPFAGETSSGSGEAKKLCGTSTESGWLRSNDNRVLGRCCMDEERDRLGEGKLPALSCQGDWGKKDEVQWVIVFPGHRTEEAFLTPTGRDEGELIRLSVALSGKSGEVGREDFPVRRVTGPVRGPRGGGGM